MLRLLLQGGHLILRRRGGRIEQFLQLTNIPAANLLVLVGILNGRSSPFIIPIQLSIGVVDVAVDIVFGATANGRRGGSERQYWNGGYRDGEDAA